MSAAVKRKFKVTKRLSGVPKNFRKWGDWKEGDLVIGKFSGTHEDQFEKVCMMLEVEDAQFANKREAEKLIGKTLVLNNAGQINKVLETIELGQWVQVIYNGMATIEKGRYKGKDSHLIEVDLLSEEAVSGEEDEGTDEEHVNPDDTDLDYDL
jgi:hypothetical protein